MHAPTAAGHVGSVKQHTISEPSRSYQCGPDHMSANPSALCLTIWITLCCALQMSDWERRPLSIKQTEYAALDAFVLLDLYDAIVEPSQGLTQQQLEPFLYSFTDQKRQQTGSNASNLAKQPSTSTQQHKQHALQPDACISAEPSSQPDQGDSAETADGKLCPADQLQTLQNSSLDGPVSTSAQVLTQRPIQPQAPLANKSERQAVALSTGSPLQQCLHKHGLEGVVKSFPSGAG